jgi:hypothetical protein
MGVQTRDKLISNFIRQTVYPWCLPQPQSMDLIFSPDDIAGPGAAQWTNVVNRAIEILKFDFRNRQ